MPVNDGTGINPSVGATEAALLLPWLLERTAARSIVDLGTGIGYFVREAERLGVRCLGVEGNEECIAKKVCKSDFLAVDVTQHVFTERFDLATSFECIEHIQLGLQPGFFRAAATASDRLICSIHYGNGENTEHYLIRPTEWWEEWFAGKGIIAKKVLDFPLENFNLSSIFDLDLRGAIL